MMFLLENDTTEIVRPVLAATCMDGWLISLFRQCELSAAQLSGPLSPYISLTPSCLEDPHALALCSSYTYKNNWNKAEIEENNK